MSILIGAFGSCLLGGIFPWIAGEVVVVSAAVLLPRELVPALILMSAAGQLSGKLVVYALARWAPERLPARGRQILGGATGFARSGRLMSLAVLSSAAVSFPPFYLVTLTCGSLGVPVRVFAAAGFGGTVIRYGVVAWGAAVLGAGLI
jgi:membrane protein YqaA with SNARE-associated domain